jgi:decaprenyl-phosphate phosphoribosyltransferase
MSTVPVPQPRPAPGAKSDTGMAMRNYLRIARVDHWFKNIFMLPGIALALLFRPLPANDVLLPIVLGILSTCLVASANYVINEWLDREFDRHHPVKHERPSVSSDLRPTWVYLEYFLLGLIGLGLAYAVSHQFLVFSIALLVMGLLYNVRPFRTKEKPYLDVLSESVNNPLRLLLGWSIFIHNALPPSSIILAYWMGGAFLMGVKRYSEYRFINDPARAGLYRKSFQSYTEQSLLLSSFFYAILSSFFLAVFLIKYRIELVLSFPAFALLFVWYLAIGLRPESAAKDPEKIFREPRFVSFVALLCGLMAVLFFVDIPILNVLTSVQLIEWSNLWKP